MRTEMLLKSPTFNIYAVRSISELNMQVRTLGDRWRCAQEVFGSIAFHWLSFTGTTAFGRTWFLRCICINTSSLQRRQEWLFCYRKSNFLEVNLRDAPRLPRVREANTARCLSSWHPSSIAPLKIIRLGLDKIGHTLVNPGPDLI